MAMLSSSPLGMVLGMLDLKKEDTGVLVGRQTAMTGKRKHKRAMMKAMEEWRRQWQEMHGGTLR